MKPLLDKLKYATEPKRTFIDMVNVSHLEDELKEKYIAIIEQRVKLLSVENL